ncbi:glycosyltransferase family 25 protein [Limnohabitans sp. Rim47]|uniref:glycosyltransferase family 25 protein n=1 Tax=Limnohabitans sp. Rim47 TaxID=1100721 RepID=UPI000368A36C|nr:glycosyltransferase family 25 protein [Limnohabitans sp. Rim47]
MKTEVLIITLASATSRRAFQQLQADRLGFTPTWHQAMGINDFGDDIFLKNAFCWQRPLKKTEVGCFLSHLQVWQKVALNSGPVVILEDDVILSEGWGEKIDDLATLKDLDCVNFEAVGKKQVGQSRLVRGVLIQRLHLNSSGAGAYLLWPKGAQKLLARYEKEGAALADVFMNEAKELNVWQLVPAVAIQMCILPYYGLPSMEEGLSQIAREKHSSPKPASLALQAKMKWRRIRGEIRKGFRRLGILVGHRRHYIPYLHHSRKLR